MVPLYLADCTCSETLPITRHNKRGENDQLVILKVRLLPILMICLVAKKKNRGEIDLAETCVNTDEALLQL